jgi:glyceraldehyde-3-phosphate dehydrogenase/erythrose-4-phosphate dehydrogenase
MMALKTLFRVPVVKAIHDEFSSFEEALMTTVHAMTGGETFH